MLAKNRGIPSAEAVKENGRHGVGRDLNGCATETIFRPPVVDRKKQSAFGKSWSWPPVENAHRRLGTLGTTALSPRLPAFAFANHPDGHSFWQDHPELHCDQSKVLQSSGCFSGRGNTACSNRAIVILGSRTVKYRREPLRDSTPHCHPST